MTNNLCRHLQLSNNTKLQEYIKGYFNTRLWGFHTIPWNISSRMDATTSPYSLDLQFRGFIEGSTIKEKSTERVLCHYFGGIPYALPPIGPYRWQRPRPLEPCYRYGTRANPGRYTGVASVCPQPGRVNPLFDEDCLQCNIWIPQGVAPEKGEPCDC